ncbi:MAG TPA: hypothetical protein VGI78_12740 [Acetobacteraceae bacterium]|jgi:hypothetical protein
MVFGHILLDANGPRNRKARTAAIEHKSRVSHVPLRVRHPVFGGDCATIDKDHLNVGSADPILLDRLIGGTLIPPTGRSRVGELYQGKSFDRAFPLQQFDGV